MAAACTAILQAVAARITALDASGVPTPGASSMTIIDGFTELAVTVEVEAGAEFIVKNAGGGLCVNFKDCDRLKRLALVFDICEFNPYAFSLLTEDAPLDSGDGRPFGWAVPAIGGETCPEGVSIELWTKRIDSAGALDPDYPYMWWVLPRTQWQVGNRTFNNGPLSHPFTGFGIENPNWFDGPSNDWPADSDRALQAVPTTTVPTVACGFTTLAAS